MARRFSLGVFVGQLLFVAVLHGAVASAQTRGGFRGAGRSGHGFGFGRTFGERHRGGAARGYFLGDTAFFYDDYPFASAVPEVAPPQYMAAQTSPTAEVPAPKAPSLLIEWQGDRYVRFGGLPLASSDARGRENGMREVPAGDGPRTNLTSENLAATVLVYRDGHREDVADYAIVGPVMYAHLTAEMAGGLHSIQISALDIAATVLANRENGVGFVLPRPNEVVTRP
jgi:hypothetical protein